jgi:hypothetical protein
MGSKAIAMRMERARILVAGCAAVFGWCVAIEHAPAQPLIPLAPPQPPIFNPSSPNIVPQTSEAPVSPNVPSALPGAGALGHSSFCGVFHRGPCFPEYLPPIGQDLRLTIVSTDENDPASKPDGDAINDVRVDKADDEKKLDSIREMYAALRACWLPPPRDSARHGMEYTIRFAFKRDGEIMAPPRVTYSSHEAPVEVRDVYRDAVNAALTRCTPLHFGKGMGGAVAGRPIAIRFVDDRTINNGKSPQ